MCALLALLLLCAAELTGWFAPLFFLPLAVCMQPLCEERLTRYAILCDLVIAAIVLALPVPHYAWLAFVCILAPYVPLRHAFRGLKNTRLATLVPIGIVLLWTTLVTVGLYFLDVHLLTVLPPLVTALFALGVLFFLFLLDIAFQLFSKAYQKRLRRFLLPRA